MVVFTYWMFGKESGDRASEMPIKIIEKNKILNINKNFNYNEVFRNNFFKESVIY
jgi:hypothetical protein